MKNYSIGMLVSKAYTELTRRVTLKYGNHRIWVYNCYSLFFVIMYLCFLVMAFVVQDQFMINCYTVLFVTAMLFRTLPFRLKNSKLIHLIVTLLVSLAAVFQLSYFRTMLPAVFLIPYVMVLSVIYDFYKDKWPLIINISLMLVLLLIGSNVKFLHYKPVVDYLGLYSIMSMMVYFVFTTFVLSVNLLVIKLKTDEICELTLKCSMSDNIVDILPEQELVPNKYSATGYLETVKTKYPTFYTTLTGKAPSLAKSELIILTLIKMNLNTAQIARQTNSSIRSIQSVKYRIRKKLSIPQDANLKEFVDSLG